MPTLLDPVRLGQLAQSAQEGDAAALSELLTQLHPKLYYTALKLTGSPADAEDLTQDACLQLLRALPGLQDPQAVLGWAMTITRNLCFNHLKHKKPYLFQDETDAGAAQDDPSEDPTGARPDLYMDMLAKREIILGMIDTLPEAQRLTVYLYYYSGHSVQEIAQLMEVSEGTVKSRLAAARSKLKLQVEEEERRGNKLYLIFPFLPRLLREDAQSTQPPVPLPVTSQQIAACAQQCAAVAALSGGGAPVQEAAGTAGEAVVQETAETAAKDAAEQTATQAGSKAAAKPAGAQAAKAAVAKGGAALGVKIAAGVAAVALLIGGVAGLPRLLQGDQGAAPSQEASAPSPAGETTAAPEPTPTPEPTPEPTQDPTNFDPEAMIGQPLSALVAIAGEPTEQDGANVRWRSGMDYDFSVVLADDGQTIRELFVIYGPPVLGLEFGAADSEAQAALAALGDPFGVNTIDTGGGQTSYSSNDPDTGLYYQFDCINGAVFNYSIHFMNW